MRRSAGPLIAVLASGVIASPASADRAGDGPIRGTGAPAAAQHHLTSTLPGSGWKQIVGAMEGTPALGTYARTALNADGATWACREQASISSAVSARRPRKKHGAVSSGAFFTVRVAQQGEHGGVRWWSGRDSHGAAVAIAVQRAPSELRSARRPWLVTRIASQLQGPSCRTRASRPPQTVRSVARTLHLAPGPVVPAAPYDTA